MIEQKTSIGKGGITNTQDFWKDQIEIYCCQNFLKYTDIKIILNEVFYKGVLMFLPEAIGCQI